VIVIVGSPIAQPNGQSIEAGGLAAEIASRCAAIGAAVQIVGRVGEDPEGDLVLLALAATDVGHVAMLREPGRPTPIAEPRADGPAGPDGPALGEAVQDEVDLADGDGTSEGGEDPATLPAGLSVDADDLELALRYVPDYRVLVVAGDLDPAAFDAVGEHRPEHVFLGTEMTKNERLVYPRSLGDLTGAGAVETLFGKQLHRDFEELFLAV
jgi:hypothetical protein